MSAAADKGGLTAWERWELADFDGPRPPAKPRGAEPAAEPEVSLPTAEEVERIHQQAHEQGYRLGHDEGTRAGHEQGIKAGYEEGQAKAREEAQRLAQLAGRLEAAIAGLDAGVADELLALSIELARQVVRHEIKAHPEMLVGAVREALTQIPQQHAAIHLNPQDASLLRSYAGDQLAHAGHRIVEDDRLGRGDCVLESGSSHVDATLATRWRRVLEGLGLEEVWTPAAEE